VLDANALLEKTLIVALLNTDSPNQSENHSPLRQSYRFPRSKILHNKKTLREVLRLGIRTHHLYYTCIHYTSTAAATPSYLSASSQWLGCPTPVAFLITRKASNATSRNRLKRILREAWRRIPQYHPKNKTIIWLIKPTALRASFQDIENSMVKTLQGL
jgi:ribonuclease P protein component